MYGILLPGASRCLKLKIGIDPRMTGRISEKYKYGCALSRRSEISHRRTSGGSAAILAAASGILPDALLLLSLSRRQDADECGLEAARSRRKSGAAAECDCRHRENMATVDPVAFFRDAPVFRFLERFPFDVTLMSASDCRHDENSNPTSGAVIPATETDRRRARLVARRACSTWNGGLCADMP